MRTALLLALATAAMPFAAQAHHSSAMFDLTRCSTLSGTVRTFEWQNPHSWLWLTVADGKGATVIWGLEFPAPSNLVSIDTRWNRAALPEGDKVTVAFAPLRDGRNGGLMNSVVLPDGTRLHAAPNSVACEEQTYGRSKGTDRLRFIPPPPKT